MAGVPLPSPGWNLVPFAAGAAVMVGANLFVLLRCLPRDGSRPSVSRSLFSAYFLLTATVFLALLTLAILRPGDASANFLLLGIQVMMSAPGVWMISVMLRADEKHVAAHSWGWPLAFAAILLANEALMGAAFTLALNGPVSFGNVGPFGLVSAFAASVDSVWFFWAMAATMVALLFWIRFAPIERWALAGLAASGVVGPWVLPIPGWGAVGMAVVMTAVFVALFEYLSRHPSVSRGEFRLVLGVAAAFLVMAAGEFASVSLGSAALASVPFALASFGAMGLELLYIARRGLVGVDPPIASEGIAWLRQPLVLTGFLGFGFAGEWFMAATLGTIGTRGTMLAAGSLGGPWWAAGGSALLQGVLAVGTVTSSPYFLLLMGVEMGALVVARMLSAASRENRTRLGMALGSFAAYTIAAPAFVPNWSRFPGSWPNLGAFGPVGSGSLVAIVGSYALFAGLAFLFGRRSYCSVLCPSAVMYGGTFSQKLIPTITESPVARRQVLGGNWRKIPQALAVTSWVAWGAVFALSAWNAFGRGPGGPWGIDPSVLYSLAVWNVVWYGTFVAIPYLGMSPCRTWGYCTTGTFAGWIGARGRYRLESRDKEVCRACTTHDCGKACEVGLVEMSVQLARTGVYRNQRCVGSHDCVVACPYGNLVARDIRDDVRRVLGLPDRHARPGTEKRSPVTRLRPTGLTASTPSGRPAPAPTDRSSVATEAV